MENKKSNLSFSGKVKEELTEHYATARHCQIAELTAIFLFCGRLFYRKTGMLYVKFQTENLGVARKCFTLLKKTFNIYTDILVKKSNASHVYTYILVIRSQEEVERFYGACKIGMTDATLCPLEAQISLLTGKGCCKRAFIRGAFLVSGSISDPSKFYHFEIVCDTLEQAQILQRMICSFEAEGGLDAKVVKRKKYYVVYLKEGAQIVTMLNIMEAHISLMDLENLRIVKEMRNTVNRRVNCETANINKTVSAAVKQIDDILFLKEHGGFSDLNNGLLDMAEVRLAYPEAALKELGELLDPPVGKSGVNHRLRKLSELASRLRDTLS